MFKFINIAHKLFSKPFRLDLINNPLSLYWFPIVQGLIFHRLVFISPDRNKKVLPLAFLIKYLFYFIWLVFRGCKDGSKCWKTIHSLTPRLWQGLKPITVFLSFPLTRKPNQIQQKLPEYVTNQYPLLSTSLIQVS